MAHGLQPDWPARLAAIFMIAAVGNAAAAALLGIMPLWTSALLGAISLLITAVARSVKGRHGTALFYGVVTLDLLWLSYYMHTVENPPIPPF